MALDSFEPADAAAAVSACGLRVQPLGPVLGAEVSGLRLKGGAGTEQAEALRALLLRHKVLFFRDLDLSHEEHLELGRVWGELEGHPVIAHVPGFPEILDIRGAEGRVEDEAGDRRFRRLDKWHADVTFRARPSMGAVLRARELPASGGDTLWADAAAAYAGLSDDVKAKIEGRTATHDLLFDFGDRVAPERRAALAEEFPPQHHPVVRRHPETGERVLYVNASFTRLLDGLEAAEGAALLAHLLDQFKTPEHQVRFHWSANAVAVWDNRSTQHYPVADYWPARRRMERVTIAGEVPEG